MIQTIWAQSCRITKAFQCLWWKEWTGRPRQRREAQKVQEAEVEVEAKKMWEAQEELGAEICETRKMWEAQKVWEALAEVEVKQMWETQTEMVSLKKVWKVKKIREAQKVQEVQSEVDSQKVWEDKNYWKAKREVEAESYWRLKQTNRMFHKINIFNPLFFFFF